MVEYEETSPSKRAETEPELSREERIAALKSDIAKRALEFEESQHAERRAMLIADIVALQMSVEKPEELSDCVDWPIFKDKIYLNKAPYEAGYMTSPTPLDPDNVSIDSIEYRMHATHWMTDRLHGTLTRLVDEGFTMNDLAYRAIVDEIEIQHGARCEQNQSAYGRLLNTIARNPDRINNEIARSIESVRSGKASSLQRIKLLAAFPEMLAIEDMKDTAALDEQGYITRLNKYFAELLELTGAEKSNDLVVVSRENEERSYRQFDNRGIYVGKSTIGHIIVDNGLTLDIVERRSYVALQDGQGLPGVHGETLKLADGESVGNAYIVGGSVYFRTQNAAVIEPESEDMGDILYVNNPLGAGPTLSA